MTPTPRPRLRVGVGAAVVLAIVAVACAVLFSALTDRGASAVVAPPAGGAASSAAEGGSMPSGASVDDGGTTDGAGSLLVHVLGAVQHPGLYALHDGDRVVDAVAAAGGFTRKADQGGVNLARVLADGEQLVVPERGAVPATGSSSGDSSGTGGATTGPGALVNLNTADETALETLPRIGPAMAQRILDYREQNGGFRSVDDLKNVTGIGDKTFEALESLVTI